MFRRPQLKNPKWNVRLKIPNTKGYVIRSTKAFDFNEGKRFSEDLYYELEGKVRRGEVLRSPPFDKVVSEFINGCDLNLQRQIPTIHRQNIQICRSHLIPFYSKTPIDEITEDKMTNFVSHQFREHNHSNATVRHHQTVMGKILQFGRRKGYVSDVPTIPKPRE